MQHFDVLKVWHPAYSFRSIHTYMHACNLTARLHAVESHRLHWRTWRSHVESDGQINVSHWPLFFLLTKSPACFLMEQIDAWFSLTHGDISFYYSWLPDWCFSAGITTPNRDKALSESLLRAVFCFNVITAQYCLLVCNSTENACYVAFLQLLLWEKQLTKRGKQLCLFLAKWIFQDEKGKKEPIQILDRRPCFSS